MTLTLRLRAGPLGSFVICAAGASTNLPLDAVGAPGCIAHVLPHWTAVAPTAAVGRSEVAIAIPNTPSLYGASFDSQWVVLDAAANALGIVTSTAVRVVVGPL